MEPIVLKRICAALQAGKRGVLVIAMGDGRARFVESDNPLVGPMKLACDDVMRSGLARRLTIAGHDYLLKPIG